MTADSERYCPYCGASLRTDANFCERCGEQVDYDQIGPQTPAADIRPEGHSREQAVQEERPNHPPSQPQNEQRGPSSQQPERIPEHYGHLFGDVYYDKRNKYLLMEITGAIIYLLPPDVFADIFRTPLRWLLENNPRVLLWVVQNYQMLALGLFLGGIASRITIGPDPIQIDREAGEGANEEAVEEAGAVGESLTKYERRQQQPTRNQSPSRASETNQKVLKVLEWYPDYVDHVEAGYLNDVRRAFENASSLDELSLTKLTQVVEAIDTYQSEFGEDPVLTDARKAMVAEWERKGGKTYSNN